ncbi:MAG: hypothetical protein IH927_09725 [Proteobacteria bacterium]|nr:hypothetical protein [Pseudomonadota bacterium]
MPPREMSEAERQALEDLALEYLQTALSKRQAREYLKNGIPQRMRDELKGDEVELVGGIDFNNLTGFVNAPRTWGVEVITRF